MVKTFHVKEGMRLGCASSATQIEGGETDSSWNDWFHRGMIKDNANPAFACEHYERYEEDFALMAELGVREYRLGIEWSRIQPAPDEFDDEAMAHYRAMLQKLLSLEIRPLLTLHHFTNPMWFERQGGFDSSSSIACFLKFVEYVVRHIGDLVSEYVTINEPNVYVTNGWFFGSWPPGKKDFSAACKVFENLAVCHIRAYEAIHRIRREMGLSGTKVGFAMHLRVFEPYRSWNPIDLVGANRMEKYFQTAITDAMALGRFSFPVKNAYKVYITENGVCDNADAIRISFLYEHLRELSQSNLPVTRYYHWSLTDNFEWLEGESARFGLIEIDYATQARRIKSSGRFYAEIIENAGVNADMIDRYLTDKRELVPTDSPDGKDEE